MFESIEVRKVANGFILIINTEDDIKEYVYDTSRKALKVIKEQLEAKAPVAELFNLYNPDKGWRFEWFPTMKTVKNLMTGKEVQIAHDTPRSCDPSTELYWSM